MFMYAALTASHAVHVTSLYTAACLKLYKRQLKLNVHTVNYCITTGPRSDPIEKASQWVIGLVQGSVTLFAHVMLHQTNSQPKRWRCTS